MTRTRNVRCATGTWAAVAALGLMAPVTMAADTPDSDTGPSSFLRVEDGGQRVVLEIATRDYVPADKDGAGPRVGLVAVAHLGDAVFYEALQEKLNSYDIVLFESVLPAGASGASGETDAERRESTRLALELIGSMLETYRSARGSYPGNLGDLDGYLRSIDARAAGWSRTAARDGWGAAIQYAHESERERFSLISFGADGAAGGDGVASDVIVSSADGLGALPLEDNDRLQAQLADALGLKFQLDAMDYDGTNWRCSDMSIDQIGRAMAERGVDFGQFSGTLAGTSFPAQLIKLMLRVMKFADTFLGGAIADTFKVVLIEMLGDESMIDVSMAQLGPGFEEVIVGMRNQVAIDDLVRIAADEADVRSVAIFYGAAHMPDLEERLATLGYKPATDEGSTTWLPAIEVDLATSSVTSADVRQIRTMMQQMMKQTMTGSR